MIPGRACPCRRDGDEAGREVPRPYGLRQRAADPQSIHTSSACTTDASPAARLPGSQSPPASVSQFPVPHRLVHPRFAKLLRGIEDICR
jgi:hypothetical protein